MLLHLCNNTIKTVANGIGIRLENIWELRHICKFSRSLVKARHGPTSQPRVIS
jgi:hypothetical protein